MKKSGRITPVHDHPALRYGEQDLWGTLQTAAAVARTKESLAFWGSSYRLAVEVGLPSLA